MAAPIALPDNYIARPGTALVVPAASGFLLNDSDPDGDPVTATQIVTGATHGTLTAFPDGSFTYTSNAGYVGTDSFIYRITDGQGGFADATVTIDVVNAIPVALPDNYAIHAGQVLTVDAANGFLQNDSDADGDSVTATQITSGVSNGTLTAFPAGNFSYTPNPGFAGTDSFTYRISDGVGGTADATVTIMVTNALPVAQSEYYSMFADQTLTVQIADGFVVNDSDPDGDPVMASQISDGVDNGILTAFPAGDFTYVPNAGYTGTDGFSYQISDGVGGIATGRTRLFVVSAANVETLTSDISLDLTSRIELLFADNLTLTGTDDIFALGNNLDNVLKGNSGDNILSGGIGSDNLQGGAGSDTLFGGSGDDTYLVNSLGDKVYETTSIVSGVDAGGTDTVRSSISFSLAANVGLNFVENLSLTGVATSATGNALGNVLTGNASANVLNGGLGNDTLAGGAGGDVLNGGSGTHDAADYSDSNAAVVVSIGGVPSASGGHATGDTFIGIEDLTGSAFGDTISGNSAQNILIGGNGADTLSASNNNDQLFGGNGDDVLNGGVGADIIDGGANVDTVSFAGIGARIVLTLLNGAGTATGSGQGAGDTITNIENITGTSFNDILTGDANANTILGGAGNDTLNGGGGADTISGQGGLDVINGGAGDDTLIGGPDADRFVYNIAALWDDDSVIGWQNNVDKIDLVGAGFDFSDFTETQDGADTLLTLTANTAHSIRLVGINANTIDATDFV